MSAISKERDAYAVERLLTIVGGWVGVRYLLPIWSLAIYEG